MSRIEVIDLVAVVDELARLKAVIAPLLEQEETLKDVLKGTGRDRIDGTLHYAKITLSEPELLDKKRLREDLGEELYLSYTSKGKLVVGCRLYGHKTS